MDNQDRIVSVEVLGQQYPVRSRLERDYVMALARYVNDKMRAAADVTPAGDSVRVAVLAALNIADEYFRCREADESRAALAGRAREIEQLVDQALAPCEMAIASAPVGLQG